MSDERKDDDVKLAEEGVFTPSGKQPLLTIGPKVMEKARNMNREQRREFMLDVRRRFKATQQKIENIRANLAKQKRELVKADATRFVDKDDTHE